MAAACLNTCSSMSPAMAQPQQVWAAATSGTVPIPHLMRGAIRGHQRPSEAIRGNQRPSEAIRVARCQFRTSDRAPRPPAPRPPAAASDTLSMSEAARCNPRRVVGVGARAPCCTSWTYLMRATIRGHQRSSAVISGHQRSSAVIRGHQRSSEVIKGHQRSSEVIRGHQRSSEVIRGH